MIDHPPHPPFKISRVLAVYCLFRGQEAAEAGQPITMCPYVDDTDDVTSFYAAHWWKRGWNRKTGGRSEPRPGQSSNAELA